MSAATVAFSSNRKVANGYGDALYYGIAGYAAIPPGDGRTSSPSSTGNLLFKFGLGSLANAIPGSDAEIKSLVPPCSSTVFDSLVITADNKLRAADCERGAGGSVWAALCDAATKQYSNEDAGTQTVTLRPQSKACLAVRRKRACTRRRARKSGRKSSHTTRLYESTSAEGSLFSTASIGDPCVAEYCQASPRRNGCRLNDQYENGSPACPPVEQLCSVGHDSPVAFTHAELHAAVACQRLSWDSEKTHDPRTRCETKASANYDGVGNENDHGETLGSRMTAVTSVRSYRSTGEVFIIGRPKDVSDSVANILVPALEALPTHSTSAIHELRPNSFDESCSKKMTPYSRSTTVPGCREEEEADDGAEAAHCMVPLYQESSLTGCSLFERQLLSAQERDLRVMESSAALDNASALAEVALLREPADAVLPREETILYPEQDRHINEYGEAATAVRSYQSTGEVFNMGRAKDASDSVANILVPAHSTSVIRELSPTSFDESCSEKLTPSSSSTTVSVYREEEEGDDGPEAAHCMVPLYRESSLTGCSLFERQLLSAQERDLRATEASTALDNESAPAEAALFRELADAVLPGEETIFYSQSDRRGNENGKAATLARIYQSEEGEVFLIGYPKDVSNSDANILVSMPEAVPWHSALQIHELRPNHFDESCSEKLTPSSSSTTVSVYGEEEEADYGAEATYCMVPLYQESSPSGCNVSERQLPSAQEQDLRATEASAALDSESALAEVAASRELADAVLPGEEIFYTQPDRRGNEDGKVAVLHPAPSPAPSNRLSSDPDHPESPIDDLRTVTRPTALSYTVDSLMEVASCLHSTVNESGLSSCGPQPTDGEDSFISTLLRLTGLAVELSAELKYVHDTAPVLRCIDFKEVDGLRRADDGASNWQRIPTF